MEITVDERLEFLTALVVAYKEKRADRSARVQRHYTAAGFDFQAFSRRNVQEIPSYIFRKLSYSPCPFIFSFR